MPGKLLRTTIAKTSFNNNSDTGFILTTGKAIQTLHDSCWSKFLDLHFIDIILKIEL